MKYESQPADANYIERTMSSIEVCKFRAMGKVHYITFYNIYPINQLPSNARLVKKPEIKIIRLKQCVVLQQAFKKWIDLLFIFKDKYSCFKYLDSNKCLYFSSWSAKAKIIPTPEIVKRVLATELL